MALYDPVRPPFSGTRTSNNDYDGEGEAPRLRKQRFHGKALRVQSALSLNPHFYKGVCQKSIKFD